MAVLLASVVLVAVKLPASSIAPPLVAEFPVRVPPVKVAAVAVKMAPPDPALLLVNALSATESGLPTQSCNKRHRRRSRRCCRRERALSDREHRPS